MLAKSFFLKLYTTFFLISFERSFQGKTRGGVSFDLSFRRKMWGETSVERSFQGKTAVSYTHLRAHET